MPETDLDTFTLTLEKIECLLSLALADGDQGKHLFLALTIISDYTAELRRISTQVSEREACR